MRKTDFQRPAGPAPAFECTHCHALNVDEAVARSDDERRSVRIAVAQRAWARAATLDELPAKTA